MKQNLILIVMAVVLITSCKNEEKTIESSVLEVTTFSLKTTSNSQAFNALDAKVQDNFTSKQPGFIRRESGVDKNGKYTVIVYWETRSDAEASMKKFMGDPSVADYASMIEGNSMKMNRYTITADFKADSSGFVEMMSFNLVDGAETNTFDTINEKVADKTATQKGFLQRITGVNENGRQVVVIYWDTKENSNNYLQTFMSDPTSKEFMGMMSQPSVEMTRSQMLTTLEPTEMSKKDKVVALLNSFNTGDQTPISYINPEKYIQHNLSVGDGLEGFGEIMKNAPSGGFKANVIRAFEDGDYVFTHTEYDFFGAKAGFDIFRFEDGLIVEHWDNMLPLQEKTVSGRTQLDGATVLVDLNKTEENKAIIKEYYDTVIIGGDFGKFANYYEGDTYLQHNPMLPDGVSGFLNGVKKMAESGVTMKLDQVHMILGQGNFVLGVSEGSLGGKPYAYYDLFRLENGKIIEHWDVMAEIPPKSEWKNDNGKF